MSDLHIALGGSEPALWQSLVTALSPAVVAAFAALGGVYLSNLSAAKHRAEDRRQRRGDRLAEAELRDAQLRRDKGLAALALAEHLEDFVLDGLKIVRSFWSVVWTSPYSWDEQCGSAPLWLKILPEWPPLVDWRLLGMDFAVRATNFRRRVQLRREFLSAGADHVDAEDQHADEGDSAAELALEAWDLACEVRRASHLDPFEWPQDWSGVTEFKEHIERRTRIWAEQAATALSLD